MLIIQFIFLLVIFLGGMYFYAKYSNPKILETLENNSKPRCPNLLIQFGSKFYLYNSNIEKVPGVNPIEFNNLEDYTDFLKWQHNVGIKCPVLYVQNTYDAQGNRVYKVRPSVSEPQGGLPPTVADNQSGNMSSIDTTIINSAFPNTVSSVTHDAKVSSKNESKLNDLDFNKLNIEYPKSMTPIEKHYSTLDDDPMNHNWGGEKYTEESVKAGKYKGSEVMFY
jgi:hypothetical protein